VEARRDFGEIITRNDVHYRLLALFYRAEAYYRLGKYERAELDLWTLVSDDEVTHVFEFLGNALLLVVLAKTGRMDEAREYVQVLLEQTPHFTTISRVTAQFRWWGDSEKELYSQVVSG
jgi:tetratricopeptide (TPR) repeat protein